MHSVFVQKLMSFFTCLIAGICMLSASPDSSATINHDSTTPYIQPYYARLARMLAVKPVFAPTSGNEFELIRTGSRYSELLLQDLEAAKSLIELEVFLFGEDKDGKRVLDVLSRKIGEGVKVRYIHDNFGNFFDNVFDGRPVFTGYFSRFRKMGIDMRVITPLLLPDPTYTAPDARNHRKINLIDNKIGYTGGMNITTGSMSGWGDTQLRITGPSVQNMRAVFLEDWNKFGKPEKLQKEIISNVSDGSGKVLQLVADGPDQPAYMMEETIVWLLENAKEYVWFETPYFLPTRPVMRAMEKAARRGIDVRLFLPEVSDMTSFDPVYRSPVKDCVKHGIKVVYRKPPFNHSKTFVCDDYITCVGSSNLDKLSLLSIYELNVLIYDESTALEHKAYLSTEQENGWIADQSFVDSWDCSERFKQALLGIFGRWL